MRPRIDATGAGSEDRGARAARPSSLRAAPPGNAHRAARGLHSVWLPGPRLPRDPAASPRRGSHDLVPAQLSTVLRAARPRRGPTGSSRLASNRATAHRWPRRWWVARAWSWPSRSTPQRSTSLGRTWNGRAHRRRPHSRRRRPRGPRARLLRPDLRHGGLPRCPAATDRAARRARPADRARHRRCAPTTDPSREDRGWRPAQEPRGRAVRLAAGTVQRRQRSAQLSRDNKQPSAETTASKRERSRSKHRRRLAQFVQRCATNVEGGWM
jgi:hypothetical protein